MDVIEDRVEALRLKLRTSRDSRRRIPDELRVEAVAFAGAAHASGQRRKAIAPSNAEPPIFSPLSRLRPTLAPETP
ncbi:MAG: hypothetical protein AAF997_06280 [Myxococcota bacterium]